MHLRSIAVLGIALATSQLHAQTPPAHAGRWVTESGNLEVEIAPCGDAWCGTVTRVLANRSMSAAGQDMDAADKRPALGMQILTGLKPSGDNTTLSGDIYNRENAKTYSVRLTMDGPQQLLVRGYVGLPLFGRTQVWRRPPDAAEPMAPDSVASRAASGFSAQPAPEPAASAPARYPSPR